MLYFLPVCCTPLQRWRPTPRPNSSSHASSRNGVDSVCSALRVEAADLDLRQRPVQTAATPKRNLTAVITLPPATNRLEGRDSSLLWAQHCFFTQNQTKLNSGYNATSSYQQVRGGGFLTSFSSTQFLYSEPNSVISLVTEWKNVVRFLMKSFRVIWVTYQHWRAGRLGGRRYSYKKYTTV